MGLPALGNIPIPSGFRHRPGTDQSALHVARARGQENMAAGACDVPGYHDRRNGSGRVRRLPGIAVLGGFQCHAVRVAVRPRRVAAKRDGCDRGDSRAGHRLGEFLRGHLPERGAWAHSAGDIARTLERTVSSRSRENLASGSTAHRAIVRSGPKGARVVLELAIQVFGFHTPGPRPVLRRISRIDELVQQLLIPRVEFHFGDGTIEVLNFYGLVLVIDGDDLKEFVGAAPVPLPNDRPDSVHSAGPPLLCSTPFNYQ